MTNEEYRRHEGVSRSELQLFRKSPKHFIYKKEHKEEDTKALKFGRAVHKFILEEDDFFNDYAVMPDIDRRTKAGKEEYEQFLIEADGKEVISQEDMQTILEMSNALDENFFARELLIGEHEQSFFWTDAETGEKCKCRPDCLTEINGKKYIVDYKTTDSCEDGHFERSAKKYGYQLQAGMYREGMFQNTFDDYGFAFVAQEKTAPYCSRVYICTDEYIEAGYDEYRALIGLYHRCIETGRFPGYEGFDATFDYLTEGE